MITHSETRRLPYTPEQMYALVADITAYPEFLPWCAACRVRARRPTPEGERVDADMVISFKVFRERFGSRVILKPEARSIDVSYLDGPFKRMVNEWRFDPAEGGGCDIRFHVEFEFRSRALQKLIGVVFNEAMRRIVRAFEARAEELYGPRPPA